MNYVAITQYPNLMFGEVVFNALSNAKFSKRTKFELLDALDRLNRYGLDSMMVGSRLKENSSGETGILHIPHDDMNLELIIETKGSFQFVIVSCQERRNLGIVGF